MNLILAVPDLNDTQYVEAVRAKVGPDAVILAVNDPRICGLRSIGDAEPLPPTLKELDYNIMELAQPVMPSRRGRRFAGGIYASRNFHKLPRSK